MRADQYEEQMLMLSNLALLPHFTFLEHSYAMKFKMKNARNAAGQKNGKSLVRNRERSRSALAEMTKKQESSLQRSIRNFYPSITWPHDFWLKCHVAKIVSNLDNATRDPTSLHTHDLCKSGRASLSARDQTVLPPYSAST